MLVRRSKALSLPPNAGGTRLPLYSTSALGVGVATAAAGTIGFFEWHLLFLLARPMLAFVLVLASLQHD